MTDPTIEFNGPAPTSANVGEKVSFSVLIETNDPFQGEVDKVLANLKVAGNLESIDKDTVVQKNQLVTVSPTHVFEASADPTAYPRTVTYVVEATVTEEGTQQETTVSTREVEIEISNPTARENTPNRLDDNEIISRRERTSARSLTETYEGFTPFAIRGILFEPDAEYVEFLFGDENEENGFYDIDFEYPNPQVAIDGSGRFTKHEIIGGSTVRQKVGEDPLNISVNGVCKRETANQIDALRDARTCTLFSDRIPVAADSILVHIGSTSTEPMADGSAADLEDGQFLYSFSINAIEVDR